MEDWPTLERVLDLGQKYPFANGYLFKWTGFMGKDEGQFVAFPCDDNGQVTGIGQAAYSNVKRGNEAEAYAKLLTLISGRYVRPDDLLSTTNR